MRRHRPDPWPAAPEFERLTTFGGAELVQDLRGRVSLRGGTPEDQARARAWVAQFMRSASLYEPPQAPLAAACPPAADARRTPPSLPGHQQPHPAGTVSQHPGAFCMAFWLRFGASSRNFAHLTWNPAQPRIVP